MRTNTVLVLSIMLRCTQVDEIHWKCSFLRLKEQQQERRRKKLLRLLWNLNMFELSASRRRIGFDWIFSLHFFWIGDSLMQCVCVCVSTSLVRWSLWCTHIFYSSLCYFPSRFSHSLSLFLSKVQCSAFLSWVRVLYFFPIHFHLGFFFRGKKRRRSETCIKIHPCVNNRRAHFWIVE